MRAFVGTYIRTYVSAMLMLLMCISGSHVLQKLSCAYFILPVDQRVFLVGICDSPKTGKHSKAQSFLNGEWCTRGRGKGSALQRHGLRPGGALFEQS